MALACVLAAVPAVAAAEAPTHLDQIVLGNAASEQSHGLSADHSETLDGALGQSARKLLPLSPPSFDGGSISFTMKIDPQAQNYVTAKLWGSDKGQNAGRLLLWAEGLQVGYRHEGDYDVLNQCDEEGEAPGRFFYETLPLPQSLTHGKTTIALKVSALGPMWPYGTTFTQYQKNLTEPSRGIYGIYTHTERRFVPDPSEKQGMFPQASIRSEPGEDVIAESKKIVIGRLDHMLQTVPSEKPIGQKDRAARLLLLGYAYNTAWAPAYRNTRAIEQIVQDGDSMAGDFASDPGFAAKDWPGAGPLGEAIILTWPAVSDRLDESTTIAGQSVQRRQAWASALLKSVNYWRTHRRSYTNQSMIVDRNIYTANRALKLIDPSKALPEAHTLHFLYEAMGIEPWLGSDHRDDGERVADSPDHGTEKPYGDTYRLITRKGLSRELGWVGTYGETILHFGCDIAKLTGDEKIRQQLAKIAHARMDFRYPGLDADGFSCMKLVSEVDNRTAHYPLTGSAYAVPYIREEWWMDLPALLINDPIVVGAAQQSLADDQYFAYIKSRLKDPDTLGMMRNVDEYDKVKSLPPSAYRLPMGEGQPDFAFADEQDAIVAIKHGDTRLFINLYYRSEHGVNNVARVYELTPTITRIATVQSETIVNSSGQTYTRPDWIDWARGRGLPPPGQEVHQAWAGEKMPIAARPAGAKLPAYGDWGPFLGKAALYQLQYGDYFVAMNSSEDKDYPLHLPSTFAGGQDLISGKPTAELAGKPLKPLSTVILYVSAASGSGS